ncbi:MAG: hypothetical protein D6826_00340 [Alphaproteobacteria bacterium]|nr:MAG: hypothetical protein D6826_00340 [Alphaproteobacteria bacterium]
MQIPDNPLRLFGLNFTQQAARSARPEPAAPSPRAPQKAAAKAAARTGTAAEAPRRVSSPERIEQALTALKTEGRIPPRGSLIDLRA